MGPHVITGLGPYAESSSSSSVAGLLRQAEGAGTLMVPPYQPISVHENAGVYELMMGGQQMCEPIPVNASPDSLSPQQVQALGLVRRGVSERPGSGTGTASTGSSSGTPSTSTPSQRPPRTSQRATFDPAAQQFNARFDQAAANSGVQRTGQRHYLTGDAQQQFLTAFARQGESASAMQTRLGLTGRAADGKIGARTIEATARNVLQDQAFSFGRVASAADAVAAAKATELVLETIATSPNFSDADRTAIRDRLQAALQTAVAALPPDQQTQVAQSLEQVASTAAGVADARAMLQTAAVPTPDRIRVMDAQQLVGQMTRPGGLDGESGTAARARLRDPAILGSVARNAEAMANPTVAAEVSAAIGELNAEQLAVFAAAVGPTAPAPVKTAIESRIDALAGQVTGAPESTKMGTLTKLRDAARAIAPDAPLRPTLQAATITLIQNASLAQLDGTDHAQGQNGFMDDLRAFYNNTLPEPVNAAITARRTAIQVEARQQQTQQRIELAQSPDVNNVYHQIIGKVVDGVQGSEDDSINTLLRQLGGANREGQMSNEGARKVGALVDRMMTENRWTGMIDDYGRGERKDLLRLLSHLPADAVSPRAMAEISRQAADRLGNDDGDVQRLRTTFNRALRAAQPADRRAMLHTIRSEHDFARDVVLDRSNLTAFREAYPEAHLASAMEEVFRDDDQRVAFMRNLVSAVADPAESSENREWAQGALDDARNIFRAPLEDGDLADVQSHITSVREGAPPAERQWLTGFWQTLEEEKRIN